MIGYANSSYSSLQLLTFAQCVYIEDVGSMHGTYVEDQRVVARERHRLYDEDLVKFGNVVTRGPGTCFVNDLTRTIFLPSAYPVDTIQEQA